MRHHRVYPLAVAALATMMLIPSVAQAVEYAPLRCGQASSPADREICKSYELGQKEARMATLYGVATALVAMGQRGDIQDKQRAWLKEREACGARFRCLNRIYDRRIGELDSVINNIASLGPY